MLGGAGGSVVAFTLHGAVVLVTVVHMLLLPIWSSIGSLSCRNRSFVASSAVAVALVAVAVAVAAVAVAVAVAAVGVEPSFTTMSSVRLSVASSHSNCAPLQ